MMSSLKSSAKPKPVLLDCDPGIDDAFAIFLALKSPEINLVGVTTVAGNQTLPTVSNNAQDLLAYFGSPQVPVAFGEARPLRRDPVVATSHGLTGLGGRTLPRVAGEPASRDGVGFLLDTVFAHRPGELTIVAIGPLTNLARALERRPDVAQHVHEVVIMGGANNAGNMSPVAEFNFFADPDAAACVLNADWKIRLLDLTLTWQSAVPRSIAQRLASTADPIAQTFSAWLDFYSQGETTPGADGPSLHDPCAMAAVIDPSLISTVPAFVAVETQSPWTLGESVVDTTGYFGREPNVQLGTTLNREGFWRLLMGYIPGTE